MKQLLVMMAVVVLVLVGCGKEEQAKATPDASANKLFVEAVQLITSAEEQTGEAAIKDYEQALGKLGEIISNYSESDLAVKLISGETLFTGKSLEEIRERVKELKRVAAESAVVTSPVRERFVESRFIAEKFMAGKFTGSELEEITSLDLVGYKITDAGLKEVDKLKNLTSVNLWENKITDAGLKHLAKLQNLTSLVLSSNKITDEDLKEVAKLQKLETLFLDDTKITDAGLKELAKLQKLEWLILDDTQITDEGVAELKKALPDCQIDGP